MNTIHLETGRLILTPLSQSDLQLFHNMNTNPFIRKYMWDDRIIDIDTSKKIIEKNTHLFQIEKCGIWKVLLKDSLRVIGYTGLWYFFGEPQPQLIYALLPQYAKQGFAAEFSQAIIDYAFSILKYKYIIAAADEPNTESQNLARRLGMKFVEKRLENDKPLMFYRIENETF